MHIVTPIQAKVGSLVYALPVSLPFAYDKKRAPNAACDSDHLCRWLYIVNIQPAPRGITSLQRRISHFTTPAQAWGDLYKVSRLRSILFRHWIL